MVHVLRATTISSKTNFTVFQHKQQIFSMRIFFVFLFIWFGENFNGTSSNLLERNKRFIIFPYGGSYKLVIGIGIPIMLPVKHKNLVFASNIQFQYPQITNLTQVQQDLPPILTRKRRFVQGQSEWTVTYLALETLMNKPNYGVNNAVSDSDIPYIEAKKAGEFGIDCLSMYPDCPPGHSLLDLISILE